MCKQSKANSRKAKEARAQSPFLQGPNPPISQGPPWFLSSREEDKPGSLPKKVVCVCVCVFHSKYYDDFSPMSVGYTTDIRVAIFSPTLKFSHQPTYTIFFSVLFGCIIRTLSIKRYSNCVTPTWLPILIRPKRCRQGGASIVKWTKQVLCYAKAVVFLVKCL